MWETKRSIKKVKRHWKEKGPSATLRAIAEVLISLVFRRRGRLVYDILLTEPREPSEWGPGERVLAFGPDNIDELSPDLLATFESERHWDDFRTIRNGNRLFIVANETEYLHRGYVYKIPSHGNDRKAIYFGEYEELPEIRSCETVPSARGRGLYRRVLNEELRYLRNLGYDRAVLNVMRENIPSIKGVTAAGFRLCRTTNDWVFFNLLVLQQVFEKGSKRWRVFLQ